MMTKEEKVENKEMTELIGKLRAMDTHDVEMTPEREKEHDQPGIVKEGLSKTKGVEDRIVHDAKPVGFQEFNSINVDADQECENMSEEGKQVSLDIIKEVLDKVIDQGLTGRKEEQMSKEERVKKYLDFVRLYCETYKMREESEMRREANVVWKQNIEDGQSVSEAGYLEQVR